MPNERASNLILRNNGLLGFVPRARPAVKLAGGVMGRYTQVLGARGEIRRNVRQPTYELGAGGRALRTMRLSAATDAAGNPATFDRDFPLSDEPIPLEIENLLNGFGMARTRDFLPIVYDGQQAIALSASGARRVKVGIQAFVDMQMFFVEATNISYRTSVAYANIGDVASVGDYVRRGDTLRQQADDLVMLIGRATEIFAGAIMPGGAKFLGTWVEALANFGGWIGGLTVAAIAGTKLGAVEGIVAVLTWPGVVAAAIAIGAIAGVAVYFSVMRAATEQQAKSGFDISAAAPAFSEREIQSGKNRISYHEEMKAKGFSQPEIDRAMLAWDKNHAADSAAIRDAAIKNGIAPTVATPDPFAGLVTALKIGGALAAGLGVIYLFGGYAKAVKYAKGAFGRAVDLDDITAAIYETHPSTWPEQRKQEKRASAYESQRGSERPAMRAAPSLREQIPGVWPYEVGPGAGPTVL